MTPNTARYAPGTEPSPGWVQPGDFILCRAATDKHHGSTTMIGQLIQAGERARCGNTDAARWTHTALIVAPGRLIEALETGVHETSLAKYRDTDYTLVHIPARGDQRDLAVQFARSQLNDGYGILNFIALAFQALTGLKLVFCAERQLICSALVARATEKMIAAYPRSPEAMMPADLAVFWGVQSGEPLPVRTVFGRLLDWATCLRR